MTGDLRGSPIGVLLVNLGTPDAPDAPSVRRYLAQFLSDPRVVEIPAILWQPILRTIILTLRPRKSAAAYREIWTDRGSPLAVTTGDLGSAMQNALGDNVRVEVAMRYGQPALDKAIDRLMAAGCDRILVVPLYPQYCGATTATVVDAVNAHLAQQRLQPTLRFLPPYHDDPAYIAALQQSVGRALDRLDFTPDVLLASFHGMPERTRILGDPYYDQCVKTTDLLSKALGRPIEMTFQSRFGRAKWLEPATADRLQSLGEARQSVAVVAPGFATDCLETLEELAIRGKEQFQTAGGRDFAYVPCLNAEASGAAMLEALIRRELAGWL